MPTTNTPNTIQMKFEPDDAKDIHEFRKSENRESFKNAVIELVRRGLKDWRREQSGA